jgi:hypothetical protein
MGTRGLIGLIIAGKRHAVYNHFDSYPDGLGRDVVRFIISLTKEEIEELINLLEEITVSVQISPLITSAVDLPCNLLSATSSNFLSHSG